MSANRPPEPIYGFSEVRVFDADGALKRVIPATALSQRPAPKSTQGSGRIAPKTGDLYATVAARKRQTPYHATRGRGGKTMDEGEL